MEENGVKAGIHYLTPGHKHQGYTKKCILPNNRLPVTEYIVNNILSLPMYPEISTVQLDEIFKSTGF